MRFKVEFEADIPLGEWAEEYGVSAAEALQQAKTDLHDSLVFLFQDPKWTAVGARLSGRPHVSLPDVFPASA